MPTFLIKASKLLPVKEKSGVLETVIHSLTEGNLRELFGLEFVAHEFSIQSFAIDTLAYDPERNAFAIIEYKKDRSFSVVDQGFAYLSLMLRNRAEFVLAYNRSKKTSKDKNDFDWSQSRVIFIAKQFTPHQMEAIGFKDLPIELWEAHLFENDTVSYTSVRVPEAKDSIRSIARGKEIEAVSREVQTFTWEEHKRRGKGVVPELSEKLREQILALGDGIVENPTKYYYGFRFHGTNFAGFHIRSDKISAFVRYPHPPAGAIAPKKDKPSAWDTTPIWRFDIKGPNDIPAAMQHIQHAYRHYEKKYTK